MNKGAEFFRLPEGERPVLKFLDQPRLNEMVYDNVITWDADGSIERLEECPWDPTDQGSGIEFTMPKHLDYKALQDLYRLRYGSVVTLEHMRAALEEMGATITRMWRRRDPQ